MALETATYIASLVTTNPDGGDQRSTADDHVRLIKAALKRTFPQLDGAVSLSSAQVMLLNDVSASVQLQLNQLRDGSATANNAINSRYANSASFAANAELLGGLSTSQYAGLARSNVFTNRNNSFRAATGAGVQLGESGADYGALGCNVTFTDVSRVYLYLATDSACLFQFSNTGVIFSHAGPGTAGTTISFSTVFSTSGAVISGTVSNATNAAAATTATTAGTATLALTANSASYAAIAGTASQATLALTANSASYAALAGTATLALTANSASYAALAGSATSATNATSANNATTLQNYQPSESATASRILARDASGDGFVRYINSNASTENPSVGEVFVQTAGDGYARKSGLANLGAYLSARNISAKQGITKTLSTSAPSGGADGDIWYRYS